MSGHLLRALVLADTHLRRDWPNRVLPPTVREMLDAADVVLHAGDVLQREHLDALAAYAPLHVVRGNNDRELHDVPERLELELAGVHVGHGPRQRAAPHRGMARAVGVPGGRCSGRGRGRVTTRGHQMLNPHPEWPTRPLTPRPDRPRSR